MMFRASFGISFTYWAPAVSGVTSTYYGFEMGCEMCFEMSFGLRTTNC